MKWMCIILVVVPLLANAQSDGKLVKLEHYAIDSFTNGTVKLKSGQVYSQRMNYNLITKEMIFEKDGKYLAIAHPDQVDTVLLGARKFVPVSDGFYEWLGGTNFPLFEEFTCTVKEPGANTGFGRSTTTAAISLQSLINLGGAYRLKLPDEFEVVAGKAFYVRKDGKYNKIKNEQQLIKLFPGKKEVINGWVKSNKTNFSKGKEMTLLIQQIQ